MSWTTNDLPIVANYSQAIGGITLFTGAMAFYSKHKCSHCRRIARYQVGPHHVPVCHAHRGREDAQPEVLKRGG